MLDNNLKVSEKKTVLAAFGASIYQPKIKKVSVSEITTFITWNGINKLMIIESRMNDRKMSSLTHRIEFSIFWFTELSLLKYKFSIKIK